MLSPGQTVKIHFDGLTFTDQDIQEFFKQPRFADRERRFWVSDLHYQDSNIEFYFDSTTEIQNIQQSLNSENHSSGVGIILNSRKWKQVKSQWKFAMPISGTEEYGYHLPKDFANS